MQRLVQEFAHFKNGIITAKILGNNLGETSRHKLKAKYEQLIEYSTRKGNTFKDMGSPLKNCGDECKKCRCKRGALPWECFKKPSKRAPPPTESPTIICKKCPTMAEERKLCATTKRKFFKLPTLYKRSTDKSCLEKSKPFGEQNVGFQNKSECEKRRYVQCMQSSCYPESCAFSPPHCLERKTYPMLEVPIKPFINGSPIVGWQKLHEKK